MSFLDERDWFQHDFPFDLPGDVWHSKDGDIKVRDMSESHIRACMRVVGEDDKWYRYFQKELNERKKLDRVTAHWEDDGYCSNCHCRTVVDVEGEEILPLKNIKEWKYCPFCGAKMEDKCVSQ